MIQLLKIHIQNNVSQMEQNQLLILLTQQVKKNIGFLSFLFSFLLFLFVIIILCSFFFSSFLFFFFSFSFFLQILDIYILKIIIFYLRGLWGDKFMRNGDGFLCVYSITSKNSFDELEVFKDQILRAKDVDIVHFRFFRFLINYFFLSLSLSFPPSLNIVFIILQCPMIILGNKCDLAEYREVPEAEGREFAKKNNALFMETRFLSFLFISFISFLLFFICLII